MFKIFGPTYEIDVKLFGRAAKEAFLYLGEDFEANLRFVSKRRIRELNRIFRGRDLVTDVLSFKLDSDASGGDIAICYQVLKCEAKKEKVAPSDMAALLTAHAILHLAGYDHTKTADRAKMEKAEEAILNKVGVNIVRQ